MDINRDGDAEIITNYTTEEWHKLRSMDITSTDVAALFGINPYLTPYELWHRKKSGLTIEIEENEHMKWGTRLQGAIAIGICQDKGWPVYRRKDEYMRRVKKAMGASFDFEVRDYLLEIKNVDSLAFRDGWIIDEGIAEAPAHIELQVQHQLAIDKTKIGTHIGALVGGNKVTVITRMRDESIINAIEGRVTQFWDSIDRNIEPRPDFVKDADFIKRLYSHAEPGKVFTGDAKMAEMVSEYQALGRIAKSAEDGRKAIKAELLIKIGDAEKVIGDGFSMSAGMIGPCRMDYDRAGYRDFKIYTKKTKEISNV